MSDTPTELLDLRPISVGFDLRQHNTAVQLDPRYHGVRYLDAHDHERCLVGSPEVQAVALQAAGYQVRLPGTGAP